MSRDQQRLRDYLAHIVQAISRVQHYTDDVDELGFLQNEMLQDAVIRNIEIIGEASHNIGKHYDAFAKSHPELPLMFAYEMRNAISHGYFKVDLEIVWKTTQNDLPQLKSLIETVLLQLSD